MIDETAFLRSMLENPGDAAHRLSYVEWLEKHGDPRANFLRIAPELDRIAYVPWLEMDGHLDYYLDNFPEVKRLADERQETEHLRRQRNAIGSTLDPEWVAYINFAGCSFQPFLFFNNGGSASECRPEELPFAERIGTRGPAVTFECDFRDGTAFEPGLMSDLRFLNNLELDDCAYGAATCPVHPFICELKPQRYPLTGFQVLQALRSRGFSNKYIQNLDATDIPYPGYHPKEGDGPHNDEVHNDFEGQYIFQKQDEDHEEEIDAFDGTHGVLKRYVADGRLWYVLLHTAPIQEDDYQFSRYAILFAVGLSPHRKRLLGVVTHQACHNLCD